MINQIIIEKAEEKARALRNALDSDIPKCLIELKTICLSFQDERLEDSLRTELRRIWLSNVIKGRPKVSKACIETSIDSLSHIQQSIAQWDSLYGVHYDHSGMIQHCFEIIKDIKLNMDRHKTIIDYTINQ